MELLQGTFNANAHEEDILALLKRSNVIVFGRKAVYFRQANPVPCAVKVLHYPEEKDTNLLSDEVSDRMAAYKQGKKIAAPVDDAQWALSFATKCIYQQEVTGFKYEVAWGDEASLRPKIKEVKPSIEDLSIGIADPHIAPEVEHLDPMPNAQQATAYQPGVAASSGDNNRAGELRQPEIAMPAGTTSANIDNVAPVDVKMEPQSTDTASPSKKRKAMAWNFTHSSSNVVIDLDDENVPNDMQPPNETAAVGSCALVPTAAAEALSQTSLIRGLGHLMSEGVPSDQGDNDADSDVIVSPLQIPQSPQPSD